MSGDFDIAYKYARCHIVSQLPAKKVDYSNLYDAYIDKGTVQFKLGRYRSALNCVEKRFVIYSWIGRIYYEYGQLKDALDYLLEAKALYSPADTGKDSPINLYINLGFIECRLVNYYAALDCFGQAFEFIYNQKHNLHCERRIFFTHNRYVYCKLGQVEIAMKNYQKSLSLHKEYHPNHPDFAQVYKNIGLIHEQIDSNYPITLSFYKRALELVPNVKHPHYILYKGMILTLELKQQKEGLIN
ncbi:unnamed protein product [Rotaria magnacalcarata]|uniref:Tetratricopeptide repeat protein n=2 Tax=Rotaria magnacalcarata TaxID=392030 RepID=A0A816QWD9_9BILA|nr:unnamed protein product [Rotaria magnacalcarata]